MKSHDSNAAWQRLVASARRAPSEALDSSAPMGFSTRVAALSAARRERPLSAVFETFSLRALGIAGLIAALAVIANVSPVLAAIEEELLVTSTDPMAEVVGL